VTTTTAYGQCSRHNPSGRQKFASEALCINRCRCTNRARCGHPAERREVPWPAGKVNPAPEDVGHPSSTKAQGRGIQKSPAPPFDNLKEIRSQFEATQEEVQLQPPPVVVVVETTWLFTPVYLFVEPDCSQILVEVMSRADLLCRPCRLAGPAHTRQLPAFRYRKEKSRERRTVCWREMDSNHRFRDNGELTPVGAAYHSMSSEE